MSKQPSEATIIRGLKRDLKIAQDSRDLYKRNFEQYRARATKAEQEVAEWKARFDTLLNRSSAPATGEEG